MIGLIELNPFKKESRKVFVKLLGKLIPSTSATLCSDADFIVGKKLLLPTYRDSLTERGTVQMLTVSREVALEVQVGCIVLESYVFISWLQKYHLNCNYL